MIGKPQVPQHILRERIQQMLDDMRASDQIEH
jgi:hypothetical protein